MPRVDYGNYLEQQDEWARSLDKLARGAAGKEALELTQIAAMTRRRLNTVLVGVGHDATGHNDRDTLT